MTLRDPAAGCFELRKLREIDLQRRNGHHSACHGIEISTLPGVLRAAGMSFAGLVLVAIALARGVPLAVPRAQWPRLVVAGFLSIAAARAR